MEVGIVRQVDIEQQMQEAYLDYAMSVIVSRALPDVRDGMKPVHRRILYAMYDMGLRQNQPYRKSARIVGEVLGKYHPHGDAAVYDAMVRMAQDFSMRTPLVDGQGNFGSVDGDPPAAMRYTEARMAAVTDEIMADIDKNTVEFADNFDSSLTEPTVLPTKVPNFLVNGASGIAVGMATSVPPHNLNEICDALNFMLDQTAKNKEVDLDDLLNFVKGPDFPTGGIIYRYGSNSRSKSNAEDSDLIKNGYAVGRARLTVQAKVHIEEMSRNRNRLVITELPYQTNKASLVEKIADLARDGKIEGIVDLRDESDRQGMRLVIELTRTVQPKKVLTRLFKMTPLQSTFSVNMLGLVDGEPRLLTLKRSLSLFIEHREEVIKRRSQYELDKAKKRAHVLEGLRIALNNLDDVIQTIRSSRSVDTARKNLIKNFSLTEIQANAILEMPLRRLAALERKKIELEYKEVLKQIKYLEGLLQSRKKILGVIKEELADIKEKYGSPRRTLIIDEPASKDQPITARDLVPDESVVVVVTDSKHICRWPAEQLLGPARGRQKDPLTVAIPASTQNTLFLFTDNGRAIITPVHQIPQGNDLGDGPTLNEFSGNGVNEVVAGLALPKDEQPGYLFLVSEQGRVKRVQLSDLYSIRGNDAEVIGIDSGDKLLTAFITPGEGDVMLVSSAGQGIRFAEEDVRAMGLSAAGVWGIKLGKNDKVVGAGAVASRTELIVVSENGFGKRTDLDEFSRQGRYGQGVIALATSKETGPVSAAAIVSLSDRVMMISDKKNTKTVYARAFSKYARSHKGQSVMSIRGKDRLARLVALSSKS
ncbi:MAG: DNA gyrase subunit A [Anaerolineae bacterium]|nr:DNA gyrase subunit A [Anaerolineae bacterium]